MRHIFIINPVSGRGRGKNLHKDILSASEKTGIPVEIYHTKGENDAEGYVREILAQREPLEQMLSPEEKDTLTFRFYACGGDGSLNEVINGAFGQPYVEVGCIPLGTGNDFIKNFPEKKDLKNWKNIENQLLGRAKDCDLIRYSGTIDGKTDTRYCANMFNIGFDSNVVDMTEKIKNLPLMPGPLAYMISVFIVLIKKKGADLEVLFEDGSGYNGKLLLFAIGNGCFCGGGIKGLAKASINDGLLDHILVYDLTRIRFMSMFTKYWKGTHLDHKKAKDLFIYKQSKSLTVIPNNGIMRLCTDGEIRDAEKVFFEIVPSSLRFSVPF